MATYSSQFSIRRLWIILAASMVVMFGTLLYFGAQIYQAAPPIPAAVAAPAARRSSRASRSRAARTSGNPWAACSKARSGATAATSRRIGRPTGCIARPCALLDGSRAAEARAAYAQLPAPDQARRGRCCAGDAHQHLRCALGRRHGHERPRGGDRGGRLRTTPLCFRALRRGARAARAVRIPGARDADGRGVRGAERILLLDRMGGEHATGPATSITYTSNWPHEPLVGNTPTGAVFMWTFISIFVLLARDRRARLVLREASSTSGVATASPRAGSRATIS